ncbi:MAG: hypothetical protein R2822_17385 [Spirosomataceae bacterium]
MSSNVNGTVYNWTEQYHNVHGHVSPVEAETVSGSLTNTTRTRDSYFRPLRPRPTTRSGTPIIATVTVTLPTASISGTVSVCQTRLFPTITFTGGTMDEQRPYTFTYKINGGPDLTLTSVGNTAIDSPQQALEGILLTAW